MKIVRPGFRPVFPRMRTAVRADEVHRPVDRGTVLIVGLQGLVVVATLVTKHSSKVLEAAGSGDEPIPVVVTDFMAEVSEQRAIGLVETCPTQLALRVVGLGEVDPD